MPDNVPPCAIRPHYVPYYGHRLGTGKGTRRGMASKRSRASFGTVRKLPSGRYQARYVGDDTVRRSKTFERKGEADAWLSQQQTDIARGDWTAKPKRSRLTFGEYFPDWLAHRQLRPRTQREYEGIYRRYLADQFDRMPLAAITVDTVRTWYAELGREFERKRAEAEQKRTETGTSRVEAGNTARSHAYALLRTVLGSAVDDGVIAANPAHIRGAGQTRRTSVTEPATPAELAAIVAGMPERLRLLVLLGAWCALRYGELAELRRSDLDLTRGVIKVRRAMVWISGRGAVVGDPKSAAGIRDVTMPPSLLPIVQEHLAKHAEAGKNGLLFPAVNGGHQNRASVSKHWKKATEAAGRPKLRMHDLRHTGAVMAAQAGATLAELMQRLGHSTVGAALRYQHAAQDRDAEIARRLDEMMNP